MRGDAGRPARGLGIGGQTLKVCDWETHEWLLTHYGDATYVAVTASNTSIVAGDNLGGIWLLDWSSQIAESTC